MMKSTFTLLVLFFCQLLLAQNQSFVFFKKINKKLSLVEQVNSITQDYFERFWILENDEVYRMDNLGKTNIKSYNKSAITKGVKKIFVSNDHKIIFIYKDSKEIGQFNLINNEWNLLSMNQIIDSVHYQVDSYKLFSGDQEIASFPTLQKESTSLDHLKQMKKIRTEDGKLPPSTPLFIEGNIVYSLYKGNLYYYEKSINNVVKTISLDIESTKNLGMRICYPISKDKYLVGFDAINSLYIYDNGKIDALFDLPVNKGFILSSKAINYFHASVYDKNQIILLDEDGKVALLDVNTYQLKKENTINALNLYLKNIFTDSKGNIWIGTYTDKILKFKPRTQIVQQFSSSKEAVINDIYRIYEDKDGLIWIGMAKGLIIIDENSTKPYSYKNDYHIPDPKFNNFSVSALLHDRNNKMLIGTYQDGLWWFDHQTLINNIKLGRENIWENIEFNKVGTNALNIRYLNENSQYTLIRTNEGLVIADDHMKLKTLSIEDGFPEVLHNNYSYVANDSLHIFGSTTGIGNIHLFGLDDQRHKSVHIDHIYYNDINQANDYEVSLNKKLSVKQPIPFISLSPSSGNERSLGTNFSYSLDAETSKNVRHDELILTTNELGSHTLNINNLQPSIFDLEDSLNIDVFIYQSWWKSKYLIALLIALALLMTYLFLKNLYRQKQYENQIKSLETESLRSQMNPHFISNSLNSINYYVLENKTDEASQYIVKFSKLIRQILNNSNQEFIPLSEEIASLRMYIEMEKMRFKNKFEYQIKIDPTVDMLRPVPSMMMQPIVENAIWHGLLQKAEHGQLFIEIIQNDKGIEVKITDDGVGRKASQHVRSKTATRRKSFGIDILNKRIKILNDLYHKNYSYKIDDLDINNTTNPGTQVTLNL